MRVSLSLIVALSLAACIGVATVADGQGQPLQPVIVADGDSITAGTGMPTAHAWPSGLARMRPDWSVVTAAIGGAKCNELASTAAARVDQYRAPGAPGVVVIWCGTNSLAWGVSPENTFSHIRGYALARRAAGWKVVAVTTLPRVGSAYLAIPETARVAFNAMILSTWPEWADGVVDPGSDLRLGGGGATTDPLYYWPDLIHLTATGQAIVAGMVEDELSRIIPVWSPLTATPTAMPTATPTEGGMTTLTIQPDGTAGSDTFIRSDLATTNFGTSTALAAGNVGGFGTFRSLIKFDLSSLPDAAVISSATLSLYATSDNSMNARTMRVYRLKRAFVESQATWNNSATSTPWTAAGGFDPADCEQADIGSLAMLGSETLNEFKDIPLTPTTKSGLDLGYGWLVRMDTESSDEYNFSSSDTATAANRPRLTIEYTMPVGGLHVIAHHWREIMGGN